MSLLLLNKVMVTEIKQVNTVGLYLRVCTKKLIFLLLNQNTYIVGTQD